MTRPLAHARTRPGQPRGFTLVELLVTAFVIGTAFIAVSWAMSMTARTKAAYAQGGGPAAFLAGEIQTLADGLPRVSGSATGATSGAAVLTLESLIGASFSPPIMADRSVAPDCEGWQQIVDLSVYALSNLNTPSADDPDDGVPAESAKLYRLDVAILHDGELVKSCSWWMHP